MPDKDYSHRLLIDKLGVKPGARVCWTGIDDPLFLDQVADRTENRFADRLECDCDVVLVGVEDQAGLARITEGKACLKPAGGLWVVYPKGVKHVTQAHVMQFGLAAGLVDNKVASFSATHSAMRFVFRRADRA